MVSERRSDYWIQSFHMLDRTHSALWIFCYVVYIVSRHDHDDLHKQVLPIPSCPSVLPGSRPSPLLKSYPLRSYCLHLPVQKSLLTLGQSASSMLRI